MKKLLLILLIIFLVGCTSNKEPLDLSIYKEYYKEIDNNTYFSDSSNNYSIKYEVTQVDNGAYRYYIFIDQPQVAMYDCVILVRENNIKYEAQTKMMPSSGIFDNKYSLVPNQIDTAGGYPKGIILSGEIDSEKIYLDILIQWNNYSRFNKTTEYIHIEN